MYRFIIRPVLFLLPPEQIHHLLIRFLKVIFFIPGVRLLFNRYYQVDHPSLERDFLGLKFSNPVGLSAGFDKNAEIFREFSVFGFSHIELGTVTPRPQPGNSKPRSFRLPVDQALINRMGFNNIGVDRMKDHLAGNPPNNLIIGGNIGKNTLTSNEDAVSDYQECFLKLYDHVDYFTVNVSCPNISDLRELQDQDKLEKILATLSSIREEKASYIPILLKISPDLNNAQIDESLEIISRYKIDGIVATNTTVSREGLDTSVSRISAIGQGGLSGKPLTKRSLEIVKYIYDKTEGQLPIIGVGGIMTTDDALNMLEAGATLIQVYTGFIYNGPGFVRRINKSILKKAGK